MICHTEFIGMYMFCFYTKFHSPVVSVLLFILHVLGFSLLWLLKSELSVISYCHIR
jgi:hypothetical protein